MTSNTQSELLAKLKLKELIDREEAALRGHLAALVALHDTQIRKQG